MTSLSDSFVTRVVVVGGLLVCTSVSAGVTGSEFISLASRDVSVGTVWLVSLFTQ